MGCTSSREARYDRRRSFGSYHRSSSLPPHNTISRCTGCGGGGYHTVSLSSSTLGTLKLDSAVESDEPMYKILNDKVVNSGDYDGEFSSDDIANAMTWSEMIEQKIPKTPTRTPPNEPETINVWELMEGLDDISPACRHDNIGRSFSFHATLDNDSGDDGSNDEFDDSNGEKDDGLGPMSGPKLSNGRSFKKPNRRRPMRLRCDEPRNSLVRERIQAFQDKINAKKAAAANARKKKMLEQTYKCPPGGEDKVVFYFTSLRGIRKTYEDCCDTLLILKGYGVRVDERDISMHAGFKEELVDILGPGFGGCTLPRVFAAGRYLGGAEEVREMDEAAKLGQVLEGCERVSIGKGGEAVGPCELCDDMRFVPCETCSGSRKVYVDEEEQEEEDADDDDGGGEIGEFRRCPHCNENGLVRCPVCCD